MREAYPAVGGHGAERVGARLLGAGHGEVGVLAGREGELADAFTLQHQERVLGRLAHLGDSGGEGGVLDLAHLGRGGHVHTQSLLGCIWRVST